MGTVLTITAVDHTTGQFTSVGHGQVTGNGPAALYVAPGGVIPSGLAAATDGWIIRVDNDHFKLADSSAHALAGTALAFADNGTLPLQLLLGVPYRRPRTAAPGIQKFSADDNAVWDALIAIWAGGGVGELATFPKGLTSTAVKFTAPISVPIPVMLSYENATGAAPSIHSKNTTGWAYAANVAPVYYPITFAAVGDVITGTTISLTKNTTGGGTTVTGELVYWDASGEHAIAGTSGAATGTGSFDIGFTHDVPVVAGRTYLVKITPCGSVAGGADHTYDVAARYTRP